MSIHIPQNFYRETVAQDWSTGTGNFYVTVKPTVSSGYMTISPSSSTTREIIFFSATGTDGTGDYITISTGGRGLGGTTEQTHVIGEPVRMNVSAETVQELSDAIDQIVVGGAQDASTSVKGIVKLNAAPTSPTSPLAVSPNGIVFESTSGVTHSLVTATGEKVMVWAKGNIANFGIGADPRTIELKYNGATKDTCVIDSNSSDPSNDKHSFALMYTETPGAATQNITVTTSGGTLSNVVIMVQKIKTQ